MWDDYGKPRPGRMPIDVYENGQIVFTQNSFASDAPIGTVVGIISVINATAPYKLSVGKNPYFSVSGHNLISNATLVSGVVYVQIFAVKGFKRIVQAIRIVVGGNSVPAPPLITGVFNLGINLSGLQGGTNSSPIGYLGQFNDFGFKNIRLPIQWERIQPTLFGSLDSGYLAEIIAFIAAANANGQRTLVDLHNFGRYNSLVLGTIGGPSIAAFRDFWTKMAIALLGLPGIRGLDLMNEWDNMDPSTSDAVFPGTTTTGPGTIYAQALVLSATNEAIAGIRSVDMSVRIYVEGLHYSSAWDFPSNNGWMLFVFDIAKNWVPSIHGYFDHDASGTNTNWLQEILPGTGVSPPGLDVTVNIGVQRAMIAIAWLKGNGFDFIHWGEFAVGSDNPQWNVALKNFLLYLQAQRVECDWFTAGPGYDNYFQGINTIAVGGVMLQARPMAILKQFTGWTGTQPTVYALTGPRRAISGQPSAPFTADYRGVLASPVAVTPHAVLAADGTTPGGTLTPSAVTMAAGENALGPFTFTPNAEDRFLVSATNNGGWADPPAALVSSIQDDFVDVDDGSITWIIPGLVREYSPYTGKSFIALHPTTGLEQEFDFTADGQPDVASWQAWAGIGVTGVKLIRLRDQGPLGWDYGPLYGYSGPSGSDMPAPDAPHLAAWSSVASDYPTLLFSHPDTGKPAVVWTAGNRMFSRLQLATASATLFHGFTGLTLSGRFKDGSHLAIFLSQELFVGGPMNWGPQGMTVKHAASNTVVVTLPFAGDPGGWQTYSTRFQSDPNNTTVGGLVHYLNESECAQIDVPPYSFDPQFAATATDVGWDRYNPGLRWSGAFSSFRVGVGASPVSVAKIAQFSATDTANWGAPFTPPPPPTFSTPLIGVNMAGNSYTNGGPAADYIGNNSTDRNKQVGYWSSRFFNVFRVNINWSNLQPTIGAALDPTYMAGLKAAVDQCNAAGIAVILDLHNYVTGTRGPGISAAADYADFWSRTATEFSYADPEMVLFGIQNEPNTATLSVIIAYASQSVTSIRATGATNRIVIDGLANSKPASFIQNIRALLAGIPDPLDRRLWDIHWYNDFGSQGTSLTAVLGAGAALLGCSRLARQLGIQLFLGETGIPNNAGMYAEGNRLFDIVSQYPDVWFGWTGWVTGTLFPQNNNYFLGQITGGPVDNPAVSTVLLPHGDARYLTGTLSGVIVNWVSSCDGGYQPSSITPGTIVATLQANDQNIKGAVYTFTKTDPDGLYTISGSNVVAATAITNGTTHSVTFHVADDHGRTADTIVPIVGADKVYLDANTKSSLVTLSNVFRTATFASGSFAQVRATRGVPPGSVCQFEVGVSDTSGFIGFCNADGNLTTDTSVLSTSIPAQGSFVGGGFQANGNMQPTFVANVSVTRTAAQVLAIWLDNINGRMSVRNVTTNGNWNGNVANDPTVGSIPVSLVPGTWYPYVGLVTSGQSATFNFAAADLVHAVASGATVIP